MFDLVLSKHTHLPPHMGSIWYPVLHCIHLHFNSVFSLFMIYLKCIYVTFHPRKEQTPIVFFLLRNCVIEWFSLELYCTDFLFLVLTFKHQGERSQISLYFHVH